MVLVVVVVAAGVPVGCGGGADAAKPATTAGAKACATLWNGDGLHRRGLSRDLQSTERALAVRGPVDFPARMADLGKGDCVLVVGDATLVVERSTSVSGKRDWVLRDPSIGTAAKELIGRARAADDALDGKVTSERFLDERKNARTGMFQPSTS